MRHKLTEADDGTVVSARIGDEVEICLHEMPSGGYRWMFEDPLADLLSHPAENFAFDQGSVGGRNTTRFLFGVKVPGRGILRLRYARSWETGAPPLKTYELIIEAA